MIKFVTDSASDIPKEYEQDLDIEIMPIPITVEDKSYYEHKDFTSDEFYNILDKTENIPTTSHINVIQFGEKYREIYEAGYDEIIHVTISSTGSAMYQTAKMARELFYKTDESLRSKIKIHVIDSKTYSYGYGLAVVCAAKMAREGKSTDEILEYLRDYFSKVEVYFSVFSLKYAKKSGRIGVAATFVGEVLGLRPIISIIDGEMKIVDKVRGDKNVAAKLSEILKTRMSDESGEYSIIFGNNKSASEDLILECKKIKDKKLIDKAQAGACITINTGPEVVGVVFLGEDRQ